MLIEVTETHEMSKGKERGRRKCMRGRKNGRRDPEASRVTFYSSSKYRHGTESAHLHNSIRLSLVSPLLSFLIFRNGDESSTDPRV